MKSTAENTALSGIEGVDADEYEGGDWFDVQKKQNSGEIFVFDGNFSRVM